MAGTRPWEVIFPYSMVGSGTKEQDMVDSEEQSMLKKRNLRWSPLPCTALIVRVRFSYAMDMPPMGNNSIAVERADGKAARTPLPTSILKPAARRSCTPLKNAAVCEVLRAPLGSRVRPCPVGSKKSSSASAFVCNAAGPGCRRSHVHDP
jgi:hypothetical protein